MANLAAHAAFLPADLAPACAAASTSHVNLLAQVSPLSARCRFGLVCNPGREKADYMRTFPGNKPQTIRIYRIDQIEGGADNSSNQHNRRTLPKAAEFGKLPGPAIQYGLRKNAHPAN